MNYREMAHAIIEKVGKKENIKMVTHCVTRLRITVIDEEKVDTDGIKAIDNVIGVVKSSGQYQVILGPIVTDVYNETMQLVGEGHHQANDDVTPSSIPVKKNLKYYGKTILDTVVSCFVPSISVISGAGMIKVMVVLLVQFGILASDSTTYTILNTIGDAIFYFLPFFVAFNACKKMEVNPALGMTLAAIVLHPNFSGLANVETGVTFIGLPVQILDYSAQAIPMIFGVWLLKYVDAIVTKISPKILSIFLISMIDLLIVAPVIILLIGPMSIWLSNILFAACTMMQSWGWIAVGINALLFPLMVLTGTHNATIPLIVQMFATQGFDPIFLVCGLAANTAEAGAACAVAVKTKNKSLKATGFSASLSALLGITEPALYGVNLRMKRPFISMLIGAFFGGCFCGLLGLIAPTFVSPSLITCSIFVPQGKSILLGFLAVIVSFIITFIITYIIGFEDLKEE